MNTTLPPQHEMVQAYQAGDASYDGLFVVAVRTTGIFCRPSCPARKPLARNVEFFGTAGQAQQAGYRACKRCSPLDLPGQAPSWVQKLLHHVHGGSSSRISDTELRSMAIDPSRARRYFKRHYGMTFQSYQRATRMGQALEEIRGGADLTGVGLRLGYDSSSGFRAAFERTYGSAPGRQRDGDGLVLRTIDSPVGPLLACAATDALLALEFGDADDPEGQFAALHKRYRRPVVPGNNDLTRRLEVELAEYFAGRRRDFSVALRYSGTDFQSQVWRSLCRIPFGQTISYKELARRVGRPRACRAVGSANGMNPLVIVVPCHRVVNQDGRLGGYGGGLWRKQFLLDHERRIFEGAEAGSRQRVTRDT